MNKIGYLKEMRSPKPYPQKEPTASGIKLLALCYRVKVYLANKVVPDQVR